MNNVIYIVPEEIMSAVNGMLQKLMAAHCLSDSEDFDRVAGVVSALGELKPTMVKDRDEIFRLFAEKVHYLESVVAELIKENFEMKMFISSNQEDMTTH